MADLDGDAQLAQALDVAALADVAALHRVAQVVHDLGDPGHADAADADEMDGADGKRHGSHRAASRMSWPLLPATTSATRSARRKADSGWPRRAAQCAAVATVCGSARSEVNRAASAAGVKLPCGIIQPAPASHSCSALAVW